MMGHFFGPCDGRIHDSHLYDLSGVEEEWINAFGPGYRMFGDAAHPVGPELLKAWPKSLAPRHSPNRAFNRVSNRHRTMVEHCFGKINQMFPFAGTRLMTENMPSGMIYSVAALLTNCHTCLHGSTVTSHFLSSTLLRGIPYINYPPTLESYLVGQPSSARRTVSLPV